MRKSIPRIIRCLLMAALTPFLWRGEPWAIVTAFILAFLANEVVTLYMSKRAEVDKGIILAYDKVDGMIKVLERYMKKMRKIVK